METLPLTDAPLAPKGSDKIWSMLSHLSALLGVGFLLPLVVYLAMRKESEYVATNAGKPALASIFPRAVRSALTALTALTLLTIPAVCSAFEASWL